MRWGLVEPGELTGLAPHAKKSTMTGQQEQDDLTAELDQSDIEMAS